MRDVHNINTKSRVCEIAWFDGLELAWSEGIISNWFSHNLSTSDEPVPNHLFTYIYSGILCIIYSEILCSRFEYIFIVCYQQMTIAAGNKMRRRPESMGGNACLQSLLQLICLMCARKLQDLHIFPRPPVFSARWLRHTQMYLDCVWVTVTRRRGAQHTLEWLRDVKVYH